MSGRNLFVVYCVCNIFSYTFVRLLVLDITHCCVLPQGISRYSPHSNDGNINSIMFMLQTDRYLYCGRVPAANAPRMHCSRSLIAQNAGL